MDERVEAVSNTDYADNYICSHDPIEICISATNPC